MSIISSRAKYKSITADPRDLDTQEPVSFNESKTNQ